MRTPKQIQTDLRNLLDLLTRSEVALFSNPVVQDSVGDGRARVTWRSQIGGRSLTAGAFGTVDEYSDWVQTGAYSAVLNDGSLLQLSYDFLREDLVAHRLLYYPCPFNIDPTLLDELSLPEVIDLYRGQPSSTLRLRSPLRFDYDLAAQADGHPASHMTLLSENCRWAVVAPLSPGHFVRFIFRHFYPEWWRRFEFLREWPQHLGDRTITAAEESHLHIACAR